MSLITVALWAQTTSPKLVPPRVIEWGSNMGDIITGENIGFQPIADPASGKDGKVIGKWMAKIDGKWVETRVAVSVVR